MSSSRIERIAMLVDLAKLDKEKIETSLQSFRMQLHEEQLQVTSLLEYQKSYSDSIQDQQTYLMSFHSRQIFLEKVNHAIITQQQKIADLKTRIQEAETAWIEKKVRHNALEQLYEKLLKNEKLLIEKQEQKFLDELAARSHFSKSNFE